MFHKIHDDFSHLFNESSYRRKAFGTEMYLEAGMNKLGV